MARTAWVRRPIEARGRRTGTTVVAGLCVLTVACTAGPGRQPAGVPSPAVTSAPPATRHASPPVPTHPSRTAPPTATSVANPAGLTDEQLVGQLFIGYVYGAGASSATPAQRRANLALYGAATGAEIVRRWHLGGIILIGRNDLDPNRPRLYSDNVDDAAQIQALTAGLQAAARADSGLRLLIGTDQEGGQVQRITNGVSWRPAQRVLAQDSPAAVRCSYSDLGRQLRSLGVNQDYAPDADVVRAGGGVIGDRSFGPDPATDAHLVVAAVDGLQAAGVLATIKHWPGHGGTQLDSHQVLPMLSETAAQWRAVDRVPFQAAAPVAASVMVGHLALPALDPSGQPATLSATLVNQQLRQQLGYRGLVLTDSLWMAPMRLAGTPGQVAIRALQAGNDMLLMSPDVPAASYAILSRMRTDASFKAQVIAAVHRIIQAKTRLLAGPSSRTC